jgi:hypothetical protein
MAAVYTFKDLQDQVLANLDEAGDTNTTLTLVKNFMNQAHQARCGQDAWTFMRWDRPETFTLTAGQRFYSLHPEFWRPIYFFNRNTNRYMVEVVERQLAASNANWNVDTGRSPLFRFAGNSQVSAQPENTGTLTIESSSASDNSSSKGIVFEVDTADGVTLEAVVPNGTTPVATTNSVIRILSVTKKAAWAGTLTVKDSDGNTLLKLFPDEYGREHTQFELLSSPTEADVIEYRFIRKPKKLQFDNDIPNIPAPYSQILVWDTLILFGGYNTDTDTKALSTWTALETAMENDMRHLYLEGSTLEAEPRFIRDSEEDSLGGPRVFVS